MFAVFAAMQTKTTFTLLLWYYNTIT